METRRRRSAQVGVSGAVPASPGRPAASPAPVPAPRVFRKVLYVPQPGFPDNYTDDRFLEELVLNADVQPREYWAVVRGSLVVSQQLSLVVTSALVFYAVQQGTLTPRTLLRANVALLLAGSALRWALLGSPLQGAVQTLREAAVVSATVALLCPLLHTLTATISGDTVAACIVASLLLHLYLHDYEPGHDVADTVAGSASLGCALFASVLLSSRLGSEAQVFAVMCFSVSVFVGWPFLRRDIVRMSFAAQAMLTAGLHLAAVLALAETVLPLLGGVHAAAVLFITFVCPWSLVRCNDLKQRINGPWDEARLS